MICHHVHVAVAVAVAVAASVGLETSESGALLSACLFVVGCICCVSRDDDDDEWSKNITLHYPRVVVVDVVNHRRQVRETSCNAT